MGYEELTTQIHTQLRDLWAGWFPGKNHNDIPGSIPPQGPIGSVDCNNVAWYEGALRKVYGYSGLTTSALNSGSSINSIFYSQILDEVVGNAGTKLYSGMDVSAPTDITGSVVVDSSELVSWTEFKLGSTEMVVGVDGVNPPWKWTGTGSAALLGGSPPTGRYALTWQNSMWLVDDEKVKFSALGDPESWDAQDNYVFDAPITGIGKLNRLLVVFFEDHIGVLSGDNNRLLIKQNRFIDGIGCSGHFTIRNARINDQDVLVFNSFDGVYAFNGSQNIIKLSNPIERKYVNSDSTNRWNDTRLENACSVFDPRYDWYRTGITDGGETTNNLELIADLARPYQLQEGVAVPFWPCDSLNKDIVSMEFIRTLSKNGDIIFGSSDGKVYKFDPALYTRDGDAYNSNYKTKVFDLVKTHIVQEENVLSDERGSSSLTVYVNPSLQEGDGNSAVINFEEDNDLLDFTFVLDESTLGGSDFIFRNAPTGAFGRFLQFKVENQVAGQEMIIIALDFILNDIGLEPNVGN